MITQKALYPPTAPLPAYPRWTRRLLHSMHDTGLRLENFFANIVSKAILNTFSSFNSPFRNLPA